MRRGSNTLGTEVDVLAAVDNPKPRRQIRFDVIFMVLSAALGLSGVAWVALAPASFENALARVQSVYRRAVGVPEPTADEFDPALVAARQAADFAEKLKEIQPRPSGPKDLEIKRDLLVSGVSKPKKKEPKVSPVTRLAQSRTPAAEPVGTNPFSKVGSSKNGGFLRSLQRGVGGLLQPPTRPQRRILPAPTPKGGSHRGGKVADGTETEQVVDGTDLKNDPAGNGTGK